MPIVNEEMAMYLHTSLQINNDRSLTSPRSCKCSILALSSSTQIFLCNRKQCRLTFRKLDFGNLSLEKEQSIVTFLN